MKLNGNGEAVAIKGFSINARRPSFQFYPADWSSNAKLRRCTFAERGVWIDVMCLMADSDEFGVLRWSLKDLANAVGCNVSALKKLRAKEVLKGADAGESIEALTYTPRHAGQNGAPVELLPAQDGPIWFSSRMVRDEYVRTVRSTKGQEEPKGGFGDEPKGGNGAHLSRARTHPPAQSSSSASSPAVKTLSAKAGSGEPASSGKDYLFGPALQCLQEQGEDAKSSRSLLAQIAKRLGNERAEVEVRRVLAGRPVHARSAVAALLKDRKVPDSTFVGVDYAKGLPGNGASA